MVLNDVARRILRFIKLSVSRVLPTPEMDPQTLICIAPRTQFSGWLLSMVVRKRSHATHESRVRILGAKSGLPAPEFEIGVRPHKESCQAWENVFWTMDNHL